MELIEALRSQSLFKNLSPEHIQQLESLSSEVRFSQGEILAKEGDVSFDFFLIIDGTVEILKKSETGNLLQIRTLGVGDLVGELAFLQNGLRSATVRTLTPCRVARIDGSTIKNDPNFLSLFAAIVLGMGQTVSERLRVTNKVTVKSMQAELDDSKLRIALGLVMMSVIFLVATYIFSLSVILEVADSLANTTPISTAMIAIFSIVLFFAVKKGGFPLRDYGLTTEQWWPRVRRGLSYSLPIMVLAVIAKAVFIGFSPDYSGQPLFSVFDPGLDTDYGRLMITVAAYVAFCPIQEFVVRGALQSSFQMFLRSNVWISILLSNLLFSAAHVHISIGFALMALIPGLYWGWIYSKDQSLVTVSVSHIAIGVWVIFIVGFHSLIAGT